MMKLKNFRLFGGRGIRCFSFWFTLGAAVNILFLWDPIIRLCPNVAMNAQVLMILSNPLLLTLFLFGMVWEYGPFPGLLVLVADSSYTEAAFHLLTMYAYGRLLDWRVFRKRPYQ